MVKTKKKIKKANKMIKKYTTSGKVLSKIHRLKVEGYISLLQDAAITSLHSLIDRLFNNTKDLYCCDNDQFEVKYETLKGLKRMLKVNFYNHPNNLKVGSKKWFSAIAYEREMKKKEVEFMNAASSRYSTDLPKKTACGLLLNNEYVFAINRINRMIANIKFAEITVVLASAINK